MPLVKGFARRFQIVERMPHAGDFLIILVSLAGNQDDIPGLRLANALHNGRAAIKFHTHGVLAIRRHPGFDRPRNGGGIFRSWIVARDDASVGKF